MGEKHTLFTPSFNGSLRVEARPYHLTAELTAEPGAVILREVIERLGTVDWLAKRLVDPRRQDRITHPLAAGISETGDLLDMRLRYAAEGWPRERRVVLVVQALADALRRGLTPGLLLQTSRQLDSPMDRSVCVAGPNAWICSPDAARRL